MKPNRGKPYDSKPNNAVAKFAHKFNKATAFTDRKKEEKKGYSKHKKDYYLSLYRDELEACLMAGLLAFALIHLDSILSLVGL